MWQIWKKKLKQEGGKNLVFAVPTPMDGTIYIYKYIYIYIYMNEWCIYISLYYVLCISRWMLHTGGGWGDTPWQCKALWVSRKALYKCNKLVIVVHPKHFTIMGWGGGGLLNHHQCCDGCHSTTAPVRSPHTSYRWREYIYIYIIALLPTTTRIWKKLLLNWKCLRAFNQYI